MVHATEDAAPRSSVASALLRARKRAALGCVAVAMGLLLAAAPAQAEFGLQNFSQTFLLTEEGSPDIQAGSHPFAVTNSFALNRKINSLSEEVPDGALRTAHFSLPPGFIGTRVGIPTCTTAEFLTFVEREPGIQEPSCPDSTALGYTHAGVVKPDGLAAFAVYNLVPPPGAVARFGFVVTAGVPVTVDFTLNPHPPYNLIAAATNVNAAVTVFSSQLTVWGVPAAPAHDPFRGHCLGHGIGPSGEALSDGICETNAPQVAYLTMPRSCTGPLTTTYEATSWEAPGVPHTGLFEAPGMTGCSALGFHPSISAKPTTLAADSPTGLDFSLDVHDEGITNPTGLANSDIEKAVVTLPEGMSVNPSQAEGLEVCTTDDLKRETLNAEPGEGCPQASKIGTVEVESPLLEEAIKGGLYVAQPYHNLAGDSLLAVYLVFKSPNLGIIVKQALRVEPDPATGRLTTVAEEIPQLPFSHFRLHFREGARSPLVSPPTCGAHTASAVLYPWAGGEPLTTTSSFEIISGPDNSPCPTAGLPPFHPHLEAGTINNAAGRFSPFNVRLTRTDSEQEITHFSIKLPPGVAGKLAGIPFCSDAAIAAATARTGPHGGQEELDSPSCPAASQVGRSLAGSGVGPALAYAPGKVYLAGPYHGHPISFVAITAGVVGPFDIGTVVVRLALDVNPETGEVFLDSTGSDPLPHIVQGIPIHLRDIRAYTDRPEFTFNPTSCEPTSTSATVLGSGLDFVSAADDNPFVSTSRFQAADCAALPFKPKLTLKLGGQTKRAGYPALHAHLSMAGMSATGAKEAGLAYTQVALPKTLFLANAHIGTVCTRVQFKEGATEGEKCPPGSVIGSAKALTPILSEPLEGPIYLRSNPERTLPDIAASLQGQEIHVIAVGHTDSAKGGGLRNTFEVIPDAPITSVDINLLGGDHGLIESSRNLCSYKPKANVKFKAHSGKQANYPKLAIKATGCTHKKKGKKRSKRHAPHR